MVHDDQPGKFFYAYYDHHCYFPLHVFCGRHLLESLLRTSNRRNSRHSSLAGTQKRHHNWYGTSTTKSGEKVSAIYRFRYQAHSWNSPRWVVVLLEEGERDSNPRLVISFHYEDGF